jgi:hypothetical protein
MAVTQVLHMSDLGIPPRVMLVNQLIKQIVRGTSSLSNSRASDPRTSQSRSSDSRTDFELALHVVDAVRLVYRRGPRP